MTIINWYNQITNGISKYSEQPLLLLLRVYVAWVFLKAGYLKITSWESTLFLFEYEYKVPFLPWELAAYLGTAAEIVLPILLLLGLATKLSALALFVFNAIAVYSYPVLWEGGFWDHKLWGLALLITMIYGAGKVSLDAYLCRRLSS